MIAETVYVLCGVFSALCAALLRRKYLRSRSRLLFWSTVCFALLALDNLLLYVDLVLLPNIDLSPLRMLVELVGGGALLYGFVWELA